MILDPIDQRIRDEGFNFVPFDRFLAERFVPKALDMSGTSALNQSNFGVPFDDSERDDRGINSLNTNREFNKKDNIFFERPDYEYDAAFPNAGRFDNILDTIKNYGMKAAASNMLSKGGAQLGFNVAGIPGALIGMLGGGALGFGARGPTDAEKVVANFYGNQGNTPMQYIDPETGELVDSLMQGYNISSAFGQGIPAAIQKRIDRIQNRKRAQTAISRKRVKDLQKELAALEAEQQRQAQNMQDSNRAMGTGGYQAGYSSDFMEGGGGGRDAAQEATSPGSSGPGGSDTMGSFMDGGRAGYEEGGSIEARLEQLGGDVTSAEQMLQNINERLQSAESSLGSGGGIGGLPGLPTNVGIFGGVRPKIVDMGGVAQPIPPQGNMVPQLGGPKIPDAVKIEDPYARTPLSGLSQDNQRFDSAQSAFDALAEKTRKYREFNPGTRDVFGTEAFQGEEGFKRFTEMFNKINDPNYVAPSPQLLSAGPPLTGGGQGVMGGSRSPLQTALGFADGGIADMLDIYD